MSTTVKPAVKPKPRTSKPTNIPPPIEGSVLPSTSTAREDEFRNDEKDVNNHKFQHVQVNSSTSKTTTSFPIADRRKTDNEKVINVDAKGRLLSFDVREDEEQVEKLQQIIDLLVTAGYFRARIKGLSPFDKVIGGLCWAIEMCNVDIDVDLIFHEDLTIGQKISLTEKIVRALQRMECPYRLEPHQMSIQGMDCIHIFPVVQWLVNKSIEFRAEYGEKIKQFAVRRFNFYHPNIPQDVVKRQIEGQSVTRIKNVDPYERPVRMFRCPNKKKIFDERMNTRMTLHEYSGSSLVDILGIQTWIPSAVISASSSTASQTTSSSLDRRKEESTSSSLDDDKQHMERLFDDGDDIKSFSSRLEDQLLGSIMEDEELMKRMQSVTAGKVVNISQERNLRTQLAAITSSLQNLRDRESSLKGDLSRLESEVSKTRLTQDELKTSISKRNETEEELRERRQLVVSLDQLKRHKISFKKACREEKSSLEAEIARLEQQQACQGGGQEEDILQRELDKEKERLKKMTLHLAQVSRDLLRIQRRLDDIPSRSEVTQYQRRFVELYDQIAAKHIEAKKFYVLFNQHQDTRIQLEKEFNLLSSVMESFSIASESVSGKGQFMSQFEQIVSNLSMTRERLESRISNERHRKDIFSRQLQDLLEKQRLYNRAIEKFKKECTKNHLLQEKINISNKNDAK